MTMVIEVVTNEEGRRARGELKLTSRSSQNTELEELATPTRTKIPL
jgi:hypothetical protein